MAEKLFRAGGASIDLVAQMPAEYIAQALEVSEEEAAAILSKALPAVQETVTEENAAAATNDPADDTADEGVAAEAGRIQRIRGC